MKKSLKKRPKRPRRVDHDLLARIEHVIAECELSPSAFGQKAVGDPGLVEDIREGRDLGWYTRERVESFIAQQSPDEPRAQ